jgi:hypothetical protein
MLKISKKQENLLGQRDYISRMRQYLYETFPETKQVPRADLDQAIQDLTERAKQYGLYLETDIAPFIVGAWLMGLHFDEQFLTVKNTLSDPGLASFEKSDFLWKFIENSFETLEK